MQYVLSKNATHNSSGTLNIQNTQIFVLEVPKLIRKHKQSNKKIYFNHVLQNDSLSNSAIIS